MKYEYAPDIEKYAREIVAKLDMRHIDLDKVGFVRSYGSRSNAIARCHGLSKAFQKAFYMQPLYVIEVISERFDKLSEKEKIKVVIHELLHIPKSFGGGFRHHDYVNDNLVDKLYRKYIDKKLL